MPVSGGMIGHGGQGIQTTRSGRPDSRNRPQGNPSPAAGSPRRRARQSAGGCSHSNKLRIADCLRSCSLSLRRDRADADTTCDCECRHFSPSPRRPDGTSFYTTESSGLRISRVGCWCNSLDRIKRTSWGMTTSSRMRSSLPLGAGSSERVAARDFCSRKSLGNFASIFRALWRWCRCSW